MRDGTQNTLDLAGELIQNRVKRDRFNDYSNIFYVLMNYFFKDDNDDLNDVLNKQLKTVNANLDAFANPIKLPEVDVPHTTAGALTRGATQFLVGYLTAYRVIKPVTKIGNLAKGMIAGVIADSTVMNPNEERLSNFIHEYLPFKIPIIEYLQAKPDDSEAEGRLKNAIEGLMIGVVVEPFIRSLRLLKYARVKALISDVKTKVHYKFENTIINLNFKPKQGLDNSIPNIKGTQVGLRDPSQIDALKTEMLNGNFEFNSIRGKIAGFIDQNGNYYVSEGHHRMAAAQEIYQSTGDRLYIDKLLENGKWDYIDKAPNNVKPLPRR